MLGAARICTNQAAAPPSCSTLTGAELPQAKGVLCLYVQGRFIVSVSLLPCRLWLARLLCQRGGSPGKNTGPCWPILAAIPFYSTIFPAALATNPPKYLVLPDPLRPKQPYRFHTWPSQGQTQVLQGSLRSQISVDNPHSEVEIKPQLKSRGSVAKEEDPKPSHKLYMLQIKSTQSTKQILCLWNI